jgi:DNA helicase II / ATP-dependent DNA helicase PcrA
VGPAAEIFVVRFTRTAAEDLKQALAELGEDIDVTARTLHSFCFSVLSREGVFDIAGRVSRILLTFKRPEPRLTVTADLV